MTHPDVAAGAALLDGTYVPSPIPRIRDQVAGFEASSGTRDNTLEDRPVIILTTVGASSLKVRKNPLIRALEGDVYVVVASAAGAPEDPQWYRNLTAHPVVRLQDGPTVDLRIAREVHGDEKDHWWQVAESFWPHFPEYREKAEGRDIPVVVLEPVD
ncbi:nitroreductase/quinone reductase family protein [Gryllotalpicola reticulitermitis]|uniref:Nitroreductase/quinone reductase family protein n=1 Tax=Gryllotalpicola reticulitermitis TaxID=1184153 RepID=A0ABV8Q402_9MICO